jgi:hypothetical protein
VRDAAGRVERLLLCVLRSPGPSSCPGACGRSAPFAHGRRGVGSRRRARAVELRDHPVVHAPAAVAPAHDVGLDRRHLARTMLREHQRLEPRLVLVRVVDEAPRALPALGRGQRDERKLALESVLAGQALTELGAGEVPGPGEVVLGHGAVDERPALTTARSSQHVSSTSVRTNAGGPRLTPMGRMCSWPRCSSE